MGNLRRIPNPMIGMYGNRRDVAWYAHLLVTTTSGTVDTTNSDQAADSAVTLVKTAAKTGRYSITLPTSHKKYVRNNAVSTAGTLDIQFAQGDTNWTDGELADAASVLILIAVANG